ncbi:hypothetical protein K1T71_003873 [Dendrolimus kikuchii]|uniref:Uncharacterized protein n=1 Tax=Dendrolimus kikuchii TaxID=765133 RepID=A0ACC1D914_9NEOP|nr:hypothetical protein K1T71_003873 [Dendrolimus kikuchii]
METLCPNNGNDCEIRVLTAALHSIHLYCAALTIVLMCCYGSARRKYRCAEGWPCQNIRGVISLALGAIWSCGAAAALLRPSATLTLTAALMAPLAWLAAAAFHVTLRIRRSGAPILYLAIYWLLSGVSAAFILWKLIITGATAYHIEVYIQATSLLLTTSLSAIDCISFYYEVTRPGLRPKTTSEKCKISYKYYDCHLYSKISFFWLNSLLYKGYQAPLEQEDLGEIPKEERSVKYYQEFKEIYKQQGTNSITNNIWSCYIREVWPNFYLAGILKLFGDSIGVIPPLGLSVIVQFTKDPGQSYDTNSQVSVQEFFNNGYVTLFLIALALISQAFLSQNSTHLVTVEGTRLKTALQTMLYDKCMRIASWSSAKTEDNEEQPLLHDTNDNTVTMQSGFLTNLISQDTYNIMSCVWFCHYLWAIPLKVLVILYFLYSKLGLSAIIGTIGSIFIVTPLQFYIGKKLSDNSKEIAKCTDHRISKMTEILQGINVIKLYVWEDLFKEKILQLREVELQHLNKESFYWSLLTFSTQISTILITAITFSIYYVIEGSSKLTAINIFAGLAFFNQLTAPLLILPVTVQMIIQAVVSTRRIQDFLELSESNNAQDDSDLPKESRDKLNETVLNEAQKNVTDGINKEDSEETEDGDCFYDNDISLIEGNEYLMSFKNAAFTWGLKNEFFEIGDLDIPKGKLIMVVGNSGSGKTSLLTALIGEMYLEKGNVTKSANCSTWYAGQPPWLLEGSVRDNIIMGNPWCQRKYSRVLRAVGLIPDLQLLPEADSTLLGSHGAPLSGGQRIRVGVARALYSNAQLLALDEPLGALDAALARHLVARGLIPAARTGRTVVVATNRLELLHYADLILVMEDGRVSGYGGSRSACGAVWMWKQLADEAREAAARAGAGPPGGTEHERSRLVRAISRAKFQKCTSDETAIGISEAAGAYLLAEVPACTGGSWRRATKHSRPALSRQFSSPPSSTSNNSKLRREVRRAVSADESNTTLQREASFICRLFQTRPNRTLTRWTPTMLRNRSTNSDTDDNHVYDDSVAETAYSLTNNGLDGNNTQKLDRLVPDKQSSEFVISEYKIWCLYACGCGVWGVMFWLAAGAAQALAVASDTWLSLTTTASTSDTEELQTWRFVEIYLMWCAGGACAAGAAQAWCACAGARARRRLHESLLHAILHAPLHHHHTVPVGSTLHRFSADVQVIDKKLPIAISRWSQLVFLCTAAVIVNIIAIPWSVIALLPAVICFLKLQSIYLCNARELQRCEAQSAASVVSLCSETFVGASTVRAGRLQNRMRTLFMRRLDQNHNALLLLNASNRWLGLTLDLVGAVSVCVSLGLVLYCGGQSAMAGLAGTYSLLFPAYLAHLAKFRADLDQHLAALQRIHTDANAPQEDYREYCPLPLVQKDSGKIEFENVNVQHDPESMSNLNNINITIASGEKVVICGRSGSGKSTLILTCVGATTINKGRVLIDGKDLLQLPLRALRHRIVVMPQELVLFSGTLRENLDPLAVHTDDEIWTVLKAVGLYDYVNTQHSGLECSVNRQQSGWGIGRLGRVCAARAALRAKHASALLLDEPAAALDAHAEKALLDALATLVPDLTIVTVTHRISSVRGYDRAVVIEEGRVVEQGAVCALLSLPSSHLARMLALAQNHSINNCTKRILKLTPAARLRTARAVRVRVHARRPNKQRVTRVNDIIC